MCLGLPRRPSQFELCPNDAVWESEYDDLSFLVWLLGQPIGKLLDLVCVTGRILLPLAKEGWKCEGVDASNEMLEICRKKATDGKLEVRLHQQRIERLKLGTRFDRIIIPGFTFQHLTEITQRPSCSPSDQEPLKSARTPDHLPLLSMGIAQVQHRPKLEASFDDYARRWQPCACL